MTVDVQNKDETERTPDSYLDVSDRVLLEATFTLLAALAKKITGTQPIVSVMQRGKQTERLAQEFNVVWND